MDQFTRSFSDPSVLWGVFGVLVVFFGIASVIFRYHWYRYTLSEPRMWKMQTIYFSVAGALVVAMILSLLSL